MKYNKIMLGAGALAILLVVGVAATASAYQGDYSKQGPEYSPERHTAMTEVMDNNDYPAWNELMANRGRITEIINAENFSQFVEARRLGEAGDVVGADVIRQELGIRTSNGEKMGARYGGGQGNAQGERQGMHKSEGQGNGHNRMNSENRGQNQGNKFVDADGDEICDNL